MTNEEAITRLKGLYGNDYKEQEQALNMAIRALKNEQTDEDLVKENTDLVKEDAENEDKKGISRKTVSQRLVKDGDLINRTDLLKELEKWDWQELYLPIHFKELVDDMPSAEKTAEWRALKNVYECSNCGVITIQKDKRNYEYCPKCKARMGVEQ